MPQLIRSASSLLEYAIETYPPQLNASTPSDPVTATLMVTVRRKAPSRNVRCDKLSLGLRTGEGGPAWTNNRSVMTGGVEGGDEPGQGDGWDWSPRDDGEWRVFHFEPTTTAEFDGWQLTVKVFEIQINNAPGWADLEIVEKTSTSGSTTEKTTSHRVQKAPKEFVFHS
ncbi:MULTISPECIES: hypothetical protein [Streptomyces]|uniref:PLAT domain-containing protein n=1 Tax=Streptomyces nigrescens TaxID=1920 RepID=A0ABY7IXF7_STRNI|nr:MULTISPECIES: hypothetical protein [Streptomyces]AWN25007.1 hypothetical protein DKG71_01570 [Streptomyces sp. NEAU-S7GS2]MCX5450643.1 hypothetical protein [Streptomyces libani]WAU02211.1 hypothetical protein STRNI_000202 [Streptomyces nigrescens]